MPFPAPLHPLPCLIVLLVGEKLFLLIHCRCQSLFAHAFFFLAQGSRLSAYLNVYTSIPCICIYLLKAVHEYFGGLFENGWAYLYHRYFSWPRTVLFLSELQHYFSHKLINFKTALFIRNKKSTLHNELCCHFRRMSFTWTCIPCYFSKFYHIQRWSAHISFWDFN